MPKRSTHLPRHQHILDLLQSKGACSYKELEKTLGVSSMTVRRDVDALAMRDALIKTLGGARSAQIPQFLLETSLSSRLGVNREEKEVIAASALGLVTAQQTLFLDGSSTCITLARHLAKAQLPLNIITNSTIVAMEVGSAPSVKVICLGGEYDPQSACLVGVLTEEACGKFFLDTVFLSTKAFSATEGTFESSIATLRIKQLIAQRCTKVVLLVDSSKFGQKALCKVLGIEGIHVVITDRKAPKAALQALRQAGCRVIVAEAKLVRAVTAG